MQGVRNQSNNGHGGIIRLLRVSALQDPGRQLPKRLLSIREAAAQSILSAHTVAEQHQRLSPAQGQPFRDLPAFQYGKTRRRDDCPDFF